MSHDRSINFIFEDATLEFHDSGTATMTVYNDDDTVTTIRLALTQDTRQWAMTAETEDQDQLALPLQLN